MTPISSETTLYGRLAVHSREGDSRYRGNVNSYCDDPHDATDRFDFVLANPPFNDSDWFRKDDEI